MKYFVGVALLAAVAKAQEQYPFVLPCEDTDAEFKAQFDAFEFEILSTVAPTNAPTTLSPTQAPITPSTSAPTLPAEPTAAPTTPVEPTAAPTAADVPEEGLLARLMSLHNDSVPYYFVGCTSEFFDVVITEEKSLARADLSSFKFNDCNTTAGFENHCQCYSLQCQPASGGAHDHDHGRLLQHFGGLDFELFADVYAKGHVVQMAHHGTSDTGCSEPFDTFHHACPLDAFSPPVAEVEATDCEVVEEALLGSISHVVPASKVIDGVEVYPEEEEEPEPALLRLHDDGKKRFFLGCNATHFDLVVESEIHTYALETVFAETIDEEKTSLGGGCSCVVAKCMNSSLVSHHHDEEEEGEHEHEDGEDDHDHDGRFVRFFQDDHDHDHEELDDEELAELAKIAFEGVDAEFHAQFYTAGYVVAVSEYPVCCDAVTHETEASTTCGLSEVFLVAPAEDDTSEDSFDPTALGVIVGLVLVAAIAVVISMRGGSDAKPAAEAEEEKKDIVVDTKEAEAATKSV